MGLVVCAFCDGGGHDGCDHADGSHGGRAARLGLGIGPLPLLDIDVAFNRIMTPLPEIFVRRTGYVALTARDGEETAAPLAAFLSWLIAEQDRAPPMQLRASSLTAVEL